MLPTLADAALFRRLFGTGFALTCGGISMKCTIVIDAVFLRGEICSQNDPPDVCDFLAFFDVQRTEALVS
ncbi:MAG: hypothetical protein JWO52_1511 [Gammaproteobacteria bacterium]|nr:hypothetical protein [Gammaproteobacteria bacterium]